MDMGPEAKYNIQSDYRTIGFVFVQQQVHSRDSAIIQTGCRGQNLPAAGH